MKKILFAAAIAAAASVFAFEDEPDELNWDRLGGTLTGFNHFRDWCAAHPESEKALLKGPRVDTLPRKLTTVWITPDAFTNAVVNQWGREVVNGETCLSAPKP